MIFHGHQGLLIHLDGVFQITLFRLIGCLQLCLQIFHGFLHFANGPQRNRVFHGIIGIGAQGNLHGILHVLSDKFQKGDCHVRIFGIGIDQVNFHGHGDHWIHSLIQREQERLVVPVEGILLRRIIHVFGQQGGWCIIGGIDDHGNWAILLRIQLFQDGRHFIQLCQQFMHQRRIEIQCLICSGVIRDIAVQHLTE